MADPNGSINSVGDNNILHIDNEVPRYEGKKIAPDFGPINIKEILHDARESVSDEFDEGSSSDGWNFEMSTGTVLVGCTEIHENLTVEDLEIHAGTKIVVRGNLAAAGIKMYRGNTITVHGNIDVETLELHEDNNIVVLGNANIGNLEMHGDDRMIVHGNLTANDIEHGEGRLIVLGNLTVGSDAEGVCIGKADNEEEAYFRDAHKSILNKVRNPELISEVEETLRAYKEALEESKTYDVKLEGANQSLTVRKPADIQVNIDMSETTDAVVHVEEIEEDSGEDRIFIELKGNDGVLTVDRPVNRQVTIDAKRTDGATIIVNTKDPVTKPAYIIDETVIDLAGAKDPKVFIDTEPVPSH